MAIPLGEAIALLLRINIDELESGLAKAKGEVTKFRNEIQKTGTAIFQKGEAKILGPGWDESKQLIKTEAEKLMSAANRMSLTAMRTILAGGGALIAALFPTKEAIEFEKALSLVAGVSRATGKELDNLRESALQMGRETIYSATQAAQAMVLLAKAGFQVNEITAMLPAVMQLAAAGELTMAESADIASAAIHGFNLAARDMAHVADVIALSANVSSVSVKDIAESLKYVAPAATAAGMGIDDVGAALAVLGNAGIRGSMAGTTLRQILIRLAEDSQKFSDAFANMGVSIYDTQGKMKPFIDIMSQMAERQVSFSQVSSVFTARSASGAQALISNVDALKRFAYENQNAAGEAKRLSDVVLNNVAGSLEYLKSSLASVSIAVAGPLLGGLKMLIDVLGTLFNTMQRISSFAPLAAFNTALGYILGTLGSILAVLLSIVAIPLGFLLTPLLAIVGTMGAFLITMGGAGIIVSGFIRSIVYLANATSILSGEVIKATVAQKAAEIAATPLVRIYNTLKTAIINAALSLWAMNWVWVASAAAIITAGWALYWWMNKNESLAASSAKAADAAASNRKEFESMTKALQDSAVGTAEHDRVLTELIKKFPELAGSIRLVNQSLEEQKAILDGFKTILMREELEKARIAMVKSYKHLMDLVRQKELFANLPPMGETPLGIEAPESFFVSPLMRMEQLAEKNKEVRKSFADMRTFIQKQLDAIDWSKVGKRAIDMSRVTWEEFRELLSVQEKSVREMTDFWLTQGFSMRQVWELMQLITKEYREQQDLMERRAVPTTNVGAFLEAQNVIERVLGEMKRELPSLTVDMSIIGIEEDTEEMAKFRHELLSMQSELAMLGADVRKHFQDEMLKAIKTAKEMGSSASEVFETMRIKILTLSKTWSDFVGNLSDKRMRDLVKFMPETGPVDFDQVAQRYKVSATTMADIQTIVNNKLKDFPSLSQAAVMGVMSLESSFNQFAVSSKGAIGYMQLMPGTAVGLGINLGMTAKEANALAKEFETLHKQYKTGKVTQDEYNAGLAKYKQTFAPVFDAVNNITGGMKYLHQGMEENAGRTDQWARTLSRYFSGSSENVVEYGKYIDDVNKRVLSVSQKVGPFKFEEIDAKQRAKEFADSYAQIENKRLQGGMATNEALAKQYVDLFNQGNAEIAASLANLADVRLKTPYDYDKIKAAENEVANARMKADRERENFNLHAARERYQIIEGEIKNRQEILKNEVQAAEKTHQLHVAEAEARKASYAAQLEMGVLTGTEYAGLVIQQENELFMEQLGTLNKRLEIIQNTAALEMLAIDAKAKTQSMEETANQRAAVRNKLEADSLDTNLKIGEAIANNAKRTSDWVSELARARKELVGISIDQLSKLAWGPIQERAAELMRNAKEYADLADRISKLPIPKAGVEPLKADPIMQTMVNDLLEAAKMLNSPWAAPLAEIVAELSGALTPERIAEIQKKLVSVIIPELKGEAIFKIKYKEQIDAATKAITSGIEEMVIGIIEGGKDLKDAAKSMFRNLFKAGIIDGMKFLEEQLKNAFKYLFQSVGGSIASSLMMVIGIIGMMLLRARGGGEFSPSGATTGITTHEAVRGIVAGETSIPIAEISISLSEAVAPHLSVLRKIEENTAKAGNVFNISIEGLTMAFKETLEKYFEEQLMTQGT